MISSLLHLVGLRPRVYYTLTNFRGGGARPPWPPPSIRQCYKRNNTRSLKLEESHSFTCMYIYNRSDPNFAKDDPFIPPTEKDEVFTQCMTKYHIWLLARVVGSSGTEQLVPGFGGFVSATETKPCRKFTIDYSTPSINRLQNILS